MPTYRVNDNESGVTLDLTGDSPPSESELTDIFSKYSAKTSAPGAAEAFAEHAAVGIAPGAAFALAAPHGARVGAAIGALVPGAGETGISEGIGAFVGGLVTGGIASWAAYKAQHAALQSTAPKFTEEMDRRLAAGSEAHPFVSVAGDVAANWPSMKASIPKLSQIPFRAALGASVGAAQPLLQGRIPTTEDVASGAAMATVFGKSRFERGVKVPPGVQKPPLEAPGGQEATSVAAPTTKTGGTLISEDVVDEAAPETPPGIKLSSKAPEQYSMFKNPGGWYQISDSAGKKVFESRNLNDASAELTRLQPEAAKAAEPPPAAAEPPTADESLIHEEAKAKGTTAVGVDESQYTKENDPANPFAPGDAAFKADIGNGRIIFSRQRYKEMMDAMRAEKFSEDKIRQVIEATIFHEADHLQRTPAEGLSYLGTVSGVERAIGDRMSRGEWGAGGVTEANRGLELMARRKQQLRGTSLEVLQAAGKEKWTLQSLDLLERTIRGSREFYGTKASQMGRDIFNQQLANIALARTAVSQNPSSPNRDSDKRETARAATVWRKELEQELHKADEEWSFGKYSEAKTKARDDAGLRYAHAKLIEEATWGEVHSGFREGTAPAQKTFAKTLDLSSQPVEGALEDKWAKWAKEIKEGTKSKDMPSSPTRKSVEQVTQDTIDGLEAAAGVASSEPSPSHTYVKHTLSPEARKNVMEWVDENTEHAVDYFSREGAGTTQAMYEFLSFKAFVRAVKRWDGSVLTADLVDLWVSELRTKVLPEIERATNRGAVKEVRVKINREIEKTLNAYREYKQSTFREQSKSFPSSPKMKSVEQVTQDTIDGLEAAASAYDKKGAPNDAAEMRQLAKTLKQKSEEQSFPSSPRMLYKQLNLLGDQRERDSALSKMAVNFANQKTAWRSGPEKSAEGWQYGMPGTFYGDREMAERHDWKSAGASERPVNISRPMVVAWDDTRNINLPKGVSATDDSGNFWSPDGKLIGDSKQFASYLHGLGYDSIITIHPEDIGGETPHRYELFVFDKPKYEQPLMPASPRFKPMRPLLPDEPGYIGATLPVSPEDRAVAGLPRGPRQAELPPSVIDPYQKGAGPLFQGKPTRGEYAKAPEDTLTPPLIETGYFRPSGSAKQPVPQGERIGSGGTPMLPAHPSAVQLEKVSSDWMDSKFNEIESGVASGNPLTDFPRFEDFERMVSIASPGRVESGNLFEMFNKAFTDRLEKSSGAVLTALEQARLDKRVRQSAGPPKGLSGDELDAWREKKGTSEPRKVALVADPAPEQAADPTLKEQIAPGLLAGTSMSAKEARAKTVTEFANALKKKQWEKAKALKKLMGAGGQPAATIPEGVSSGGGVQQELLGATVPEAVHHQTEAQRIKAEREFARSAKHEAKRITETFIEGQDRREKIIGNLAAEVKDEATQGWKDSASRTSVAPQDIRFVKEYPGADQKTPSWGDASQMLSAQLVEGGSVNNAPKSVTRSAVVVENIKTGKVSIVSAYEERGRSDLTPSERIRIVDPDSGAARQHSAVGTMLGRYRLRYRMLLDQPVQKFRQDFKDMSDFMEKFGNEANARNADIQGSEQPETPGTPGIPAARPLGEPPGRSAAQAAKSSALSDKEATQVQRFIDDAIGHEPKSAGEVREALDSLKSGEDVDPAAMTGIQKIADLVEREYPRARIEKENPHLTASEVTDAQLDRMSSMMFNDKNLEKTIAKLAKPELPTAVPQPKGGRELKAIESAPIPGARYDRGLDEWVPIEPQMPSSPRRIPKDLAVKAADKVAKVERMTVAAFKRGPLKEDISRGADAVNTEAVVAGDQSAASIDLESAEKPKGGWRGIFNVAKGKKDILSAANPLVASGAAKMRFVASPEALDLLNKKIEADPRCAEARERMTTTERKWNKETDLLGKEKMVKGGLGAPRGGDVARVGREMMRDIRKKAINELRESGDITMDGAEVYYDPTAKSKLDGFLMMLANGDKKAERLIKSGNWLEGRRGRAWKSSNAKLRAEVEFAKAHWGNPELVNTAMQASMELGKVFDQRVQAGFGTKFREEFLPGRYDGEFVDNDSVSFFGESRGMLGMRSGEKKTFDNYYHAAQEGSYIPATRDIATLVGNSVKQATRRINRDAWMDSWTTIKDEATGRPFAMKPIHTERGYSSPDSHYDLVTVGGKTMAVLRGDGVRLVRQLTDPSFVQDWAPTRLALETGQWLKHTLLMGDFFHLFRIGYYSASIMGSKVGMTPGWAALHFREADIPKAVERGVLNEGAAKWLNEKLPTNIDGKLGTMSRIGLAKAYQHEGLNVGQIGDAIYKDLSKNVPLFGGYNKFLFDKWTRGLMMRSAIEEYQRKMASNPKADSRTVMRETAHDLNIYFGSLGKQSWVKSAGWQDVLRIFFLAPGWQEGLLRKELAIPKALGKAVMDRSPQRLLEGRDTAARGIARGLVSMLVLTQVANLITRRHPTWENKEEGQKWNADMGEGVFISPTSVYNEVAHDLIRLHETKRNNWDVVKQIGSNKLGFWGRVATVMATSRKPTGEAITTTGGVLGEVGKQLVPVPMTFGKAGQLIGHSLAPGLVPPLEPGQAYRQALATAGFKGEIARTPLRETQAKASRFMQDSGLKPLAAITIPTDEPSYAKLRHSIQIGDERGAAGILRELRKTKPEGQIIQAMNQWARRPFTGGYDSERMFLDSLDDNGREAYDQAVQQKQDLLNKWVDWYIKTQP